MQIEKLNENFFLFIKNKKKIKTKYKFNNLKLFSFKNLNISKLLNMNIQKYLYYSI
jgi:hypothetical protein